MKKATFLVVAAMLLAVCLPVFAQEFPDVPSDHWAYNALQSLVSAGVIQGYPDGTFQGKRAMTRYEFAEALAKAIPAIAAQVQPGTASEGIKGDKGEPGIQGPKGDKGDAGMTPEQIANLTRMANEFSDELASLGVDVDALKRDVQALSDRVGAIEAEMDRIKISGQVNEIAYGTVNNTIEGDVFDIDGSVLPNGTDPKNPVANSVISSDVDFGVRAKAGDMVANVLFNAGNYTSDFLGLTNDTFTLWNAYISGGMKLGPLGNAEVTVGRQPFQLTDLTLKFVDPDSYTYLDKTDSGNYLLDMAKVGFGFGSVRLTAFAAKSAPTSEFGELMLPNLAGGVFTENLGGVRATISDVLNSNIGLTWYETGNDTPGRSQIYGADVNSAFGKLAFGAEYAKSKANDALEDVLGTDDDTAWNASLGYQFGKLGIKGGYTTVEANYFAPGYWSKLGRAVNLRNVKGATANLDYSFGSKLSLNAMYSQLEPKNDDATISSRASFDPAEVDLDGTLDQIEYWKAGIKYSLTSANSVDLGWEEVNWKPETGTSTRERYYNIGFGHAFNPSASLKLLYQIIEYRAGDIAPYESNSDGRGGVASAQMQLKF